MYGLYANFFADYVKGILSQYSSWIPLYLTTLIGFDGVTASQRVTCYTPAVDSDALLFGGHVNFSNAGVGVKITDSGSGYSWNVLQSVTGATTSGTPITALAGVQTEVMPILALTCPYFLGRQSKLQMDFVNGSASIAASTSSITWVGLKLIK